MTGVIENGTKQLMIGRGTQLFERRGFMCFENEKSDDRITPKSVIVSTYVRG